MVIFDEPRTGLDIKTEQLIVNTVNQFSKEKTIITIAHRQEVLKYADNFIKVNNGDVQVTNSPLKGGQFT